MIPATLFGAPLGYTPSTLAEWTSALNAAWTSFSDGREPLKLENDLELMKEVFGQGATPKKLRETVGKLGSPSPFALTLPMELSVPFEEVGLITPEGRILIDVLKKLRDENRYVIDEGLQIWALSIGLRTRIEWYDAWATKQISGTLSPAPIGAAVLILMNAGGEPGSQFLLPNDTVDDEEYTRVVLSLVGNFSEALGGKRPAVSPLRGHWAFTQATRMLNQDLSRLPLGDGAAIRVKPNREQHLLHDLQTRLSKYPPSQVWDALEALWEGYRTHRGLFIAMGIGNERAVHTRRMIDVLGGASNG